MVLDPMSAQPEEASSMRLTDKLNLKIINLQENHLMLYCLTKLSAVKGAVTADRFDGICIS